jgi:aspartate aminotransferase
VSRLPELSAWARSEVEKGGWVRRGYEQARRLRDLHGDGNVADLSLGQPLEAPEKAREAFIAAARDGRARRHGYMPNLGFPELQERIAEDVGVAGVTAQGIAVTPGAAGAISLALRTFLDAGDEVVGVAPYFSEFRLYSAAAGLDFVAAPGDRNGGVDLGTLEAALGERTRAVILNSPGNPSGRVIGTEPMAEVAHLLDEHRRRTGVEVLLIVDEVYRNLVYAPSHRAEPFDHWPRTALCRSFSKDLGIAGERLGYLAVHPSLTSADTAAAMALCQRALGYVNAPATAQLALLALDDWSVDVTPYRERRDLIAAAISAAGLEAAPCEGGLYTWVRSPLEDTMRFVDALMEERCVVVPGVAFGVADHVRLCFSVPRAQIGIAEAALRAVTDRVSAAS